MGIPLLSRVNQLKNEFLRVSACVFHATKSLQASKTVSFFLEQCSAYSTGQPTSDFMHWFSLPCTAWIFMCNVICVYLYDPDGDRFNNPSWPIFIYGFGLFTSIAIWQQLVCVFTCRPWEILYDYRLVTIAIVQIVGFFQCQLCIYRLGVRAHTDQLKKQHDLSAAHKDSHPI